MANTLPWFPFKPSSWRGDPGIRALNFEERGIWFEMLLLMHESEEYGYLSLNGKAIPYGLLAKMIGIDENKFMTVLQRLLDLGVCKKEPDKPALETKELDNDKGQVISEDKGRVIGRLYNRRMVIDNRTRLEAVKNGRNGGNPNFEKGKPNPYYKKRKDLDNDNPSLITDNITPPITLEYKKLEEENSEKNLLRRSESTHEKQFGNTPKRGTRITRDYSPSEEVKDFCLFECPDLTIETELPDFIDYWIAVPGKAGLKLDWDATFRNNLRKHQKWADERKHSPMGEAERLAALDAEAERREKELAKKNGDKEPEHHPLFDDDEML